MSECRLANYNYHIDAVKEMLKAMFSERGGPLQSVEEAAYIHFVDFLDEYQGMNAKKPDILFYGRVVF